MRKLFLSSYFSGVASLLPDFVGGTCSGKKIVFIPTASLPEKVNFYVSADRKALVKLGFVIDELEIGNALPEEITNRLTNADFIFVEGGNTFFLLQEMKRTGSDKLIIEHINNEKPYIGASAGSMILSKNIDYVKYMDNPEAAPALNGNFSALSIVNFCIVPHCTNFPFKKAAERIIFEYSNMLDLRPISNNQVITLNGDNIERLTAKSKHK